MPSLTIRDLPESVHRKLREQAERHHRSLNSEVIATLSSVVVPARVDSEAMLQRIRALRESIQIKGPPLTDEEINRMKRHGRP